MKKIYCSVSTLLTTFLSSVIALLTTSSCDRISPARVEYGTPSAEFEVKATVLSEEGAPISGIQLELLDESGRVKDRELTDSKGNADLEEDMFRFREQVRQVRATDIDGAQNGFWENSEVTIHVKELMLKEDGRWRDKAEKHIIIHLREKKDARSL